jgi:hypothetical protein
MVTNRQPSSRTSTSPSTCIAAIAFDIADIAFDIACDIASDISNKGALTSLNLSSNNLKAEGGKIVAEAIKVTDNAMGVVLVPISCPSDHWLSCCCLLLSTG